MQASYGHRVAGCVFCALEGSGRVLLENEGHSLVIPRRHGADGLELHQPEWNAVVELLRLWREQLSAKDPTFSGWNVRLNSGEAAGRLTKIGRRTEWVKPMVGRSLLGLKPQVALQIAAHRWR